MVASFSSGMGGGGIGSSYAGYTPWAGGSAAYAAALGNNTYNPSLSSLSPAASYSSGWSSPGLAGDQQSTAASWLALQQPSNPYSGFSSPSYTGSWGGEPGGAAADPWAINNPGEAGPANVFDGVEGQTWMQPSTAPASPAWNPYSGAYSTPTMPAGSPYNQNNYSPGKAGDRPSFSPVPQFGVDQSSDAGAYRQRAEDAFAQAHGYRPGGDNQAWVDQTAQQLANADFGSRWGAATEAAPQTAIDNRWPSAAEQFQPYQQPGMPRQSFLDNAQLDPSDFLSGGPSTGRNPPMLDYDPLQQPNWAGNTPTGYRNTRGEWIDFAQLNPADFGVDDLEGRFTFGPAPQAGRANIPTDAWAQQALRGSDLGQGLVRQGPELPPDYAPPGPPFDQRYPETIGPFPTTESFKARFPIVDSMTRQQGGGWFEEPQAAPLDNFLRQQQEMQAARDWYAQASG